MRRDSLFAGVSLTVMLHASLVFLIVARDGNTGCAGGSSKDARASNFDNARTIEASLAFKQEGEKTKQPQKRKKKKFKPVEAEPVSRDAERDPLEPDEDKERPDKDEIDYESILEKNRKQDEDLSDTGADFQEGAPEGSEWGTAEFAKGDPYVGELHGRVKANYKVPSLETGKGVARGCVKLDEEGKIAERQLLEKSSNANLDRAVELALDEATDMEAPVPAHLEWLITNGICFDFKL